MKAMDFGNLGANHSEITLYLDNSKLKISCVTQVSDRINLYS